ncbi:MAG: SDR family NAD(P)-dependent oxidoreductase, partial [Pararheinheimera sp.]|nr:SDR family NAD(P)-dependent oxidoreductase [Rheinheimera sp.]
MKTVLVTGADGFIGSHLVEYLLSQGYQVRALAQYNSFNSAGWLDGFAHPALEIHYGDVRDAFFCDALCQGIEIVFHLAALIAIPYSYSAPQSYIETNVNGTLNMCQAALKQGVKRFIQTST